MLNEEQHFTARHNAMNPTAPVTPITTLRHPQYAGQELPRTELGTSDWRALRARENQTGEGLPARFIGTSRGQYRYDSPQGYSFDIIQEHGRWRYA